MRAGATRRGLGRGSGEGGDVTRLQSWAEYTIKRTE